MVLEHLQPSKVKIVILSTENRSFIIFGKALRPKVYGKWTNSRSFPRIFFLAQLKSKLQSYKSTPDSLKQRLKAYKIKLSSGGQD